MKGCGRSYLFLVEPAKRSDEIQAIPKLDQIGQTRSALNTAQNKLQTAHRIATAQVESNRNALQLHLQISTLRAQDLPDSVNQRRKVLNLPEITELTADTKVTAWLSDAAKPLDFNKDSALRDLRALADASEGFSTLAKTEVGQVLSDLGMLEADPALLSHCSNVPSSKRDSIWSMGQIAPSAIYQFCKLLKTQFPNTQFIITTHDRLWAEQMKSAGLVTSKTSIAFHSWTVDTGPLVESNKEIWDEIDAALAKGKVEVAAAALRHHLEYVSPLLRINSVQLHSFVPMVTMNSEISSQAFWRA